MIQQALDEGGISGDYGLNSLTIEDFLNALIEDSDLEEVVGVLNMIAKKDLCSVKLDKR